MTPQQFKRIARLLKESYKELELEALHNGIAITSEAYTQLRDRVRLQVLEREGFTLEEYIAGRDEVQAERAAQRKGDKGDPGDTPTDERLIELIKPLIPAPLPGDKGDSVKPSEQELLKLIKPLLSKIKEVTVSSEQIQTVIKPVVDAIYNQFSTDVAYLDDKVNNIKFPTPETQDYEKWKTDFLAASSQFFHDNFSENFQKNIDILGMPNFRSLAVGLREDIDKRVIGVGTNLITLSATQPSNPKEGDIWIDIS